jgi:hypothetical protein
MTRSNLYVKLSNGQVINCVADSSSAPEQGYIVENLIIPLMECKGTDKELALLTEHCAMYELRLNADYRYILNLQNKAVHFFEENYNYKKDRFCIGKDLTGRLRDYIDSTQTLREIFEQLDIKTDKP